MTPAAGSDQAFAYLRKVIYDASAIVLEQDKRYLLEARLGPMLIREQIPTYDALVARLQGPNAAPLRQKVVESLTTHETSFFRDLHPFEILRKNVIPQLLMQQAASKRLNIWCAVASPGQEPYTSFGAADVGHTDFAASRPGYVQHGIVFYGHSVLLKR